MTVTREIQGLLAKGDFGGIEEEWLARLNESTGDLEFFVGVARALVGNGEDKRARTLLELLDDDLRGRGRMDVRLALLRRVGHLLFDPERLHPAILSTLKAVHGRSPSFPGLVEKVGLQRAVDDIPKTWDKVDRLEILLGLDVGTIVAVEGKGVGRVKEVNLALEAFKVELLGGPVLTVGFSAAGKLVRPLPPEHFLRRKVEDAAGLAALRDGDPPELLRLVLASLGKPATAAEIKAALAGVVDEKGWTSFWAAARKHPQVVTAGGGRQTYTWAATSGAAEEALVAAFERADPRAKIELLRRRGGRDDALRERLAVSLRQVGGAVAAQDPGLAFEIWFALERSGAPLDVDWDPDTLLAARGGWRKLVAGVQDRLLRERACAMIRERFPAEWPELFADLLLREEDPRTLDFLASALEQERPELVERQWDALLAQPRKAPAAFTWLVERSASDERARARNPLRLVQQLLAGLTADELASYRVRLRAQCESGGALPRALSLLREEQAAAAGEAIARAPGLESYQRDALTNALELRFPALRQASAQQPFYATPASITAKRAEVKQLLEVDIPANRKAIEEARALGDLRENFEYKSARQRHEYLASRVAALHRDLERAQPIQVPGAGVDDVRIGTRVTLAGTDQAAGHTRTLTILGPWESQPEAGVVSYESELAKGLLGKRRGETVEIGATVWTVREITPHQ